MVEAVATFPQAEDPFKQIFEREDVRNARSLSEGDAIILREVRKLRGEETVVFDSSATVSAFEASNREAMQELARLRVEKEGKRNSQREKRRSALLEIDAIGYFWGMIFNPPKP